MRPVRSKETKLTALSKSEDKPAGKGSAKVRVQAGFVDGSLYVHLDIQDDSPSFADPGLGLLDGGDYLEVLFSDDHGKEKKLLVIAGSPGPVVGRALPSGDGELDQQKTSPDYRLSGHWVSNASSDD